MSATRPPLEYLVTCSQMSLESVELSRLNQAANLRKEFHQILEEWIDSEVDARLARSILEWKRDQCSDAETKMCPIAEPVRYEQLPIAFLPDSSAPVVQSEQPDLPQLQLAEFSHERVPPRKTSCALTQLRTSNRDSSTTKSRPVQLEKAVEKKLREVERLAVCLSRQVRANPNSDETNAHRELPRTESVAPDFLPVPKRAHVFARSCAFAGSANISDCRARTSRVS